ncbi:MAG: hypothetical protein WBP12_04465 [Candidatus Saccharimonas sp.]
MPRRNHTPKSTKRLPNTTPEAGKIRYPTKAAADRQIREIQKYQPDIRLSTYRSPVDSGWYLTSG